MMAELIEEIYGRIEFLTPLSAIGYIAKGLFGLTSIYGLVRFIQDLFSYKTINLSIGSFKIERKHINASNLTNIVSAYFYDGGTIPNEIRREIINLTMPKIRNLRMKGTKTKK